MGFQSTLHLYDAFQRFQEKRRDHRDLMKPLHFDAASQQLCDSVDIIIPKTCDILEQSFAFHLSKLAAVEMADACFKRADRFQEAFLQG